MVTRTLDDFLTYRPPLRPGDRVRFACRGARLGRVRRLIGETFAVVDSAYGLVKLHRDDLTLTPPSLFDANSHSADLSPPAPNKPPPRPTLRWLPAPPSSKPR